MIKLAHHKVNGPYAKNTKSLSIFDNILKNAVLMTQRYQIYYFPYLFLKDYNNSVITLGNVSIWNFEKEKKTRIPDNKMRDYILKLLSSEQKDRKPIEDIGIVQLEGAENFRPLEKLEKQTIYDIKIILFLSVVSHCNTGNYGCNTGSRILTSDNFSLLCKPFDPKKETTASSAGKIVGVTRIGEEVGEVYYDAPRHIHAPSSGWDIDQTFCDALLRLREKDKKRFRSLALATESMMNGYSNSDDISYESRILEQCRAFEILLQLPLKARKKFKEKIEKFCDPNGEETTIHL